MIKVWASTMSNTSVAAKQMARDIKSEKALMDNLNTVTNTSKASMIGARVAATALNMALSMGLAVGIQLIISGLDKMVHAAKDASKGHTLH